MQGPYRAWSDALFPFTRHTSPILISPDPPAVYQTFLWARNLSITNFDTYFVEVFSIVSLLRFHAISKDPPCHEFGKWHSY